MRSSLLPILGAMSALALASCAPTASTTAPPLPRQAKAAEDKAAITAQARAFSAAYVAGDAEAMAAIYTADGVAMSGSRDPVVGRDALSDYWRLAPGVKILSHESVSDELVLGPRFATDRGIYRGTSSRDGAPVQRWSGPYLIVWERGTDDVWRMAQDMWASHDEPQ